MEVIKLQRYERQFLKEVSDDSLDRLTKNNKNKASADRKSGGNKKSEGKDLPAPADFSNFDPRNNPSRPGQVRGRDRDDSGNLLLDLVLAGAVKKSDH